MTLEKIKLAVSMLGLALLGSASWAALPDFNPAGQDRAILNSVSGMASKAAARVQDRTSPVLLPGNPPQGAPAIITSLGPEGLKHFLKLAAYAWKKQGGTLAVIYRRARHSDIRNLWGPIYPRNGVYLQVKGQQRPDGSLELGQMLLALKISRWPPYGGETAIFSIDPKGNISNDVRLEVDDSDDMPDPNWKPDQLYYGSKATLSGAQDDLAQAIAVMMSTHIVAGRAVTRPLMGFIP